MSDCGSSLAHSDIPHKNLATFILVRQGRYGTKNDLVSVNKNKFENGLLRWVLIFGKKLPFYGILLFLLTLFNINMLRENDYHSKIIPC